MEKRGNYVEESKETGKAKKAKSKDMTRVVRR